MDKLKTFRVRQEIHQEAMLASIDEGISLKDFVEQVIRKELDERYRLKSFLRSFITLKYS